jgi:hypothetical protein
MAEEASDTTNPRKYVSTASGFYKALDKSLAAWEDENAKGSNILELVSLTQYLGLLLDNGGNELKPGVKMGRRWNDFAGTNPDIVSSWRRPVHKIQKAIDVLTLQIQPVPNP